MPIYLSDIKKPGSFKIKKLNGTDATRLMEMGVLPGLPLDVIRRAPLGFPIEIKVRGMLLTLREVEAKCIELED
ncbi:MAG: FeoA family protein [Balneolaceae bacterium]